MQLLMNQQLDTRLDALSEALIEERKEMQAAHESEVNMLKAEIQTVQASVKRTSTLDRSPSNRNLAFARQESSRNLGGISVETSN